MLICIYYIIFSPDPSFSFANTSCYLFVRPFLKPPSHTHIYSHTSWFNIRNILWQSLISGTPPQPTPHSLLDTINDSFKTAKLPSAKQPWVHCTCPLSADSPHQPHHLALPLQWWFNGSWRSLHRPPWLSQTPHWRAFSSGYTYPSVQLLSHMFMCLCEWLFN